MAVKRSHPQRSLLLLACSVVVMFSLALPGLAACPGTETEALNWLDKMSRSLQEVNYQGIVTFQRGDEMQAMQVSHSVVDGLATERLTELTGQGAEIVRINHPLECVHPGHRLLQLGTEMQAGRCGVARYYRFRVSEGELVAGRQAVQIRVEPRDMYRYGHIMELDRETGLLLKSQIIGRGDKILEKFQFASLSYAPNTGYSVEPHLVHLAEHPAPGVVGKADDGLGQTWTAKWLPEGFTSTDEPAADAARKTYTDGLAVFSIFLEILNGDIRPGEGVVRTGGTTSYTRGMHLFGQSVLVTVIGEVPLNTARMVADSITGVQ